MENVRALVLTGFGINCEEETRAAFTLAGATAEIVHLKDIFSGDKSIFDYDIIAFPGGFSFGDDLGAGRVLANFLRYRKLPSGKLFFDQLHEYLNSGKYILGICNGFQTLVSLGLLPGLDIHFEQEVSLFGNNSGKFEDRWVRCKIKEGPASEILGGGRVIDLPVRHAEGKLVVKDPKVAKEIVQKGLICMEYCDKGGVSTDEYPQNPNGSFMNCAALCNSTGQVIGMMPHPEAFLSIYNHPAWGQILRDNPEYPQDGEGLQLFTNMVQFLKKRKVEWSKEPSLV